MSVIREYLEISQTADLNKHDHVAHTAELRVAETGALQVPATVMGSVAPLWPTDWAWRQLETKLGPVAFGRGSNRSLPHDYLFSLPSHIRADALNYHLGRADK